MRRVCQHPSCYLVVYEVSFCSALFARHCWVLCCEVFHIFDTTFTLFPIFSVVICFGNNGEEECTLILFGLLFIPNKGLILLYSIQIMWKNWRIHQWTIFIVMKILAHSTRIKVYIELLKLKGNIFTSTST